MCSSPELVMISTKTAQHAPMLVNETKLVENRESGIVGQQIPTFSIYFWKAKRRAGGRELKWELSSFEPAVAPNRSQNIRKDQCIFNMILKYEILRFYLFVFKYELKCDKNTSPAALATRHMGNRQNHLSKFGKFIF